MIREKRGFTMAEIMVAVAVLVLIAAIAIPNFVRARERTYEELCATNLKRIEEAKAMWGLATNASKYASPTESDIAEYIKSGFPQPVIAGCSYAIGNLMTPVYCDAHFPAPSGSDENSFVLFMDPILKREIIVDKMKNDPWYWSWYFFNGIGYFEKWDFADFISYNRWGAYNESYPTGAPIMEWGGKVWEFEHLTHIPDFKGRDFWTGERIVYKETFYGSRTFPGRPELTSYMSIEAQTGKVSYWDWTHSSYYYRGEYVEVTGNQPVGFYNRLTGQMEYFKEGDIPQGSTEGRVDFYEMYYAQQQEVAAAASTTTTTTDTTYTDTTYTDTTTTDTSYTDTYTTATDTTATDTASTIPTVSTTDTLSSTTTAATTGSVTGTSSTSGSGTTTAASTSTPTTSTTTTASTTDGVSTDSGGTSTADTTATSSSGKSEGKGQKAGHDKK